MSRPTYLTIDLDALRHNLARIHYYAPSLPVIAMVKANAYGHGLQRVASALRGADAFGVASLEEGVLLRHAGIKQPIVLMEGLFYRDELEDAAKYRFTLVVHNDLHVKILEESHIKVPFAIWLKINTGMHRLGIDPAALPAIYQRLLASANVKKPIGLMTHFAEADHIENKTTEEQLHLFNQVTRTLEGPRSLANSAAILAWKSAHGDWVRPGLMLYGASPFSEDVGLKYDLQPVMTLSSRLIAITNVKQGSKVGYGGNWVAQQDTRIGVVGVGYGDGYPQFARNGTPVLVNATECSLAGRVSMDMLTVDLTNQPNAQIGDPVVLWGKGLPVELVAQQNQTSAYEILTRMTPRPKIEVKGVEGEEEPKHQERLSPG